MNAMISFLNSITLYDSLKLDAENAIKDKTVVVWDKAQQNTYTTAIPNLDRHVVLFDCRPNKNDEYGIYEMTKVTYSDIRTMAGHIFTADLKGFEMYLQKGGRKGEI